MSVSFPRLGKFSVIMSSIMFSAPSSFPSRTFYNANISELDVVLKVSLTVFISFHYFFFCSISVIFTTFFQLTDCSSVSFSLLLIPSSALFISIPVHPFYSQVL